jgi:AcrR family transcriptional regulator
MGPALVASATDIEATIRGAMHVAERTGGTRTRGRPRDPALDDVILDAALRLLAASGFQGMSINDVAAAAGTSKVTIYNRFRNKAELVGAALGRLHVVRRREITGNTEEDLVWLLGAMHQEYESVQGMGIIGACLTAEGDNPELLRIVRERSFRLRREGFVEVLRHGVESGELVADLDVEQVTSVLIGAYYADYFAARPLDAARDRAVVRLVLAGLRTGG